MGPVYENIIDVGDEVPGFSLDSQLGSIFFREIIDGKWALLVTFNKAFDPVATTDLAMLSRLMDEFTARNIFVIAVGTDSGWLLLTKLISTFDILDLPLFSYGLNRSYSIKLSFMD